MTDGLWLSPTAMNEAEICLRRAQYYMDPDRPRLTNQFALVGQAWHHALESYYGARQRDPAVFDLPTEVVEWRMLTIGTGWLEEGWEQPDFRFTPDTSTLRTQQDCIQAVTRMTEAWGMGRHTVGTEWDDEYEIVATEARVMTEMKHHLFRGVIDLVLRHQGLGTVIVDHKTAKQKWSSVKQDLRRLVQAPLYAEAWFKATGEDPTWAAYDVMTHKGAFTRIWVPVAREVRAYTLDRWTDLGDLISWYRERDQDMPMNTNSPLCQSRYCPHWEYCPSGEALDRTTLAAYPEPEPEPIWLN